MMTAADVTHEMKLAFYHIKVEEHEAYRTSVLFGIGDYYSTRAWTIVDGMRKMFSFMFCPYHEIEILWVKCGLPSLDEIWEEENL